MVGAERFPNSASLLPWCEYVATAGAIGTMDNASDCGRLGRQPLSGSSDYADDVVFLSSARHQKCSGPLLSFVYLLPEGQVAFPEYL